MDVGSWQRRLTQTFFANGVIAAEWMPTILDMEDHCGFWFVDRFKGHRILKDCFVDFYATTVAAAANDVRQRGWPSDRQWYGFVLQGYRTLLLSHRTADCLVLKGYWYDGFALLRNIWEQTMRYSAAANSISTYSKIEGIEDYPGSSPLTDEGYERIHRARVKEERRIERWAFGVDSGLSATSMIELSRLKKMFNRQVHGFRFSSLSSGSKWLYKAGEDFSLGPLPDIDAAAMFMNRSDEIAWCTHRILPLLQVESGSFGDDWGEKWNILDDSFRQAVVSLAEMGKKLSPAFLEFIDAKFPFSPRDFHKE
jgi:hypothetical protein